FGEVRRDGPDGLETIIQYDTANRLEFMQRGWANDFPVLAASFTYNGIGLLTDVGERKTYEYDDAHRLTRIEHKTPGGTTRLRLDYTYTADDLPETITEYGPGGTMTADVEFTYDSRRRLIHEVRMTYDGTPGYNLAYEYDAGGNRTKKVDNLAQTEVRYHYDLEDPQGYGSKNNRLMFYKEFDTTQPPTEPGDPGALVSTTWYYYHYGEDGKSTGNVERVVTMEELLPTTYQSVLMHYGRNARTVTNVVGETWEWDGAASCVPAIDYDRTFATEFRYDGPRQRYLTRALNPATLQPYGNDGDSWTDYDGDEPYGDFSIDALLHNKQSFEPGLGRFGWLSTNEPDENTKSYYHTDHLGTIRGVTDFLAYWTEAMTFTAFGERIVGTQN
ncbi:MAG: hypothetical protein Q7R41_19630, partial [Phycisphaerales bacterium]|nr:hypothetical protein [Phycisphaerales bacterium]